MAESNISFLFNYGLFPEVIERSKGIVFIKNRVERVIVQQDYKPITALLLTLLTIVSIAMNTP